MKADIRAFHQALSSADEKICNRLAGIIDGELPNADNKIWHAHPVWFLSGNPIVGYSKLKDCVRLMFWSGAAFDEPGLVAGTGKFKDASVRYTSADQIDERDMRRWLGKARTIQWDYKNLRVRGKLLRIG
jgi:hypothetical protein